MSITRNIITPSQPAVKQGQGRRGKNPTLVRGWAVSTFLPYELFSLERRWSP